MKEVDENLRKLKRYADQMKEYRRKLISYKASLDSSWQGYEVTGLNEAIDVVNRRLNRLYSDMEELARDIAVNQQEYEEEQQLLNLPEEEA